MTPLETLRESIREQARSFEGWRRPAETLLFETLRAIDDLMVWRALNTEPKTVTETAHDGLCSWGINKALSMVMPIKLAHGPFRLFPSTEDTQAQTDLLLLQAGALENAELLEGWLSDGLINGRVDIPNGPLASGISRILVLKTALPSLFQEVVAGKSRKWMSDLSHRVDLDTEHRLEREHFDILPEIVKHVERFGPWGMTYTSTREIDEHFLEWAKIYLRRIPHRDLFEVTDVIGGNQYNEHLGMVVALSARAQKHLCFASIAKQRYPDIDTRNLLTSYCPCDEFVSEIANFMDADRLQTQKLLSCLTLEPSNSTLHLGGNDPAWAPIVRSSADYYILPIYGLDINPFLFQLRSVEALYPDDWSRLANGRERRWQAELADVFVRPRWTTVERGLKLRDGPSVVTDLDFVTYDTEANELALFQLKWQRPVGPGNRTRKSAGKNLTVECEKWLAALDRWLRKYGTDELVRRLGLTVRPGLRIQIFVLARDNARFSGYEVRDGEAVWADWGHFVQAFVETRGASPSALAGRIRNQVDDILRKYPGDSYMIPLGDMAIILNPTSEPNAQMA